MAMKIAQDMPNKKGFVWLSDDLNEIETNTFGQMGKHACAIAHSLLATDKLSKGDSVLLVFNPNRSFEFVCAFFGCLLAGVIAVVLDNPSPGTLGDYFHQIGRIADETGSRLVLTTASFYQFMINSQSKLGLACGIEYRWPSSLSWKAVDSIPSDTIGSKTIGDYLENVGSGDPALFLVTNVSPSGVPKGVMVYHSCLCQSITLYNSQISNHHGVIFCAWLTVHSSMELIGGVIGCASNGYTMVSSSSSHWISSPLMWLKCMSKHGGTHTCASTTILARCITDWEQLEEDLRPRLDLRCVSCISVAFEPASINILNKFQRVFSGCGLSKDALKPAYGLTDRFLYLSFGDGFFLSEAESSKGIAAIRGIQQGIHMRIVNSSTLEECSPGEDGEIWVSNHNAPTPKKLPKEVKVVEFDGKSFFSTGDLGCVQKGSLYALGKLADVMVVDGSYLYPHVIEATELNSGFEVKLGQVVAFALGQDRGGLAVEVAVDYLSVETAQEICRTIAATVEREHHVSIGNVLLVKPR